jgi:Leucine-rich repeat (LRR) protein
MPDVLFLLLILLLQMVSFKSNGLVSIHADALQSQLRWLILTDNQLSYIPSTIGRCIKLQKLMLSGNKLTGLPEEISNCQKLELVRLASNSLDKVGWLSTA